MTDDDLSTAFDTLDARAAAAAGPMPLDRISLRDHVVKVEIGAFQAERGQTQRIRFSVVVEVRPTAEPHEDDVDRILSYDTIAQAIRHELAAERLNLLETLADRVAGNILNEPAAERVFLRIEKLDRGPGALGVEIVRSKAPDAGARPRPREDLPHPRVVLLSNAAIGSPNLAGWLDQLQAQDRPAILCVGRPETTVPQSASAAAQRRIDLLAMDQNAWLLSGRDGRCFVAASRTELDWAARNRRLAVWAPAKMILDAVDGAPADPSDSGATVAWLAETVSAPDMIFVGIEPPAHPRITARQVDPAQAALF